jgi:D-glycero-alpha-D-manno-heptose-7-phosphate kinase
MKEHLKPLVVRADQSILDGIEAIERAPVQMALVIDQQDKLVGILTNGDVRRWLMRGGNPRAGLRDCMNTDFHAESVDAPRERILKLFDLGFNAVPLLDAQGRLVDFATPDFFPPTEESAVLARARAPARISFSGGGTDLTYYFMDHAGVVLHASIALYAHATLIPSNSPEISIYSLDIHREEHYRDLRTLLANENRSLLSSVVAVIRPAYGFTLHVHSDFPVGSGLGGSSAVTTSIISAFNEFRMDKWSNYEMAELAFQAERLCFGIDGGWQDQYAAAFGGFNLIEFDGHRNTVHSLRLESNVINELEECLILCDTGIKHDSGSIHAIQRSEFLNSDREAELGQMVDLCRHMHHHLIRGELQEFGMRLHDAWELKHGFSTSISGDALDKIYAEARAAGALGGKLLGAGGGGFFLFFARPRQHAAVTAALQSLGCSVRPMRFERNGVLSWRTKIA